LQLTNSQNPRLFSGNTLGKPSILVHYKNYRDLSPSTYLEFGLTGLLGWNDEWDVDRGGTIVTVDESRSTRVFGADINYLWEPTDEMRYRNVEWRTEAYYLNRDLLAPDDTGGQTINAWGAYSYLQSRRNRQLILGVRVDFFEPDEKDYTIVPLVLDQDAYQFQVGPYLTWEQSPFVHWRIEYNHLDGKGVGGAKDTLYVQLVFAAGPHKHERY